MQWISTYWFFILAPYWIHLLVLADFGVWGFSIYYMLSSAKNESFTSYQFEWLLFLAWLLGIPALCWIKGGRVGILMLFLILQEKLCFSPLNVMSALGFSCLAFIILTYVVPKPTLFRVFIMNGYYTFFIMLLLHLSKWLYGFYPFSWCVMYYDWFTNIELPFIPGIIPLDCVGWVIFLMYCWIWFANILLRILTSMYVRDIGL